MKLSVAEREGKGDKGISSEQEARGSRPSCPFSLARGLAPNFLGPFFPFERLPRRLHQNRVLSRQLLPNDRYDVCRRIQSYLIRTKSIKDNATSPSSKCAMYPPCELFSTFSQVAINDRFTKLNSTG